MPKLPIDGPEPIELHYDDYGSGDPVVLVHGLHCTPLVFAQMLNDLRSDTVTRPSGEMRAAVPTFVA